MYACKHARMDVCMHKCRGNEMMDGQTNKWMAEGVIQFHLSMMKIKLIKDKMQSSSRCKVNIAITKVYIGLIYLQPTD